MQQQRSAPAVVAVVVDVIWSTDKAVKVHDMDGDAVWLSRSMIVMERDDVRAGSTVRIEATPRYLREKNLLD